MTTAVINDWRELSSRECDGLVVGLFWSRKADQVKVAVADTRLDEAFEFRVASCDALAAFTHPFAYAPSPGFGFGSLEAECAFHLRQQV